MGGDGTNATAPPGPFEPRPLGATDAAAAVLEARADPRVGVDLGARVFSRDFEGGLDARARDLSVGGVCVASESPFAFKSVERLVLDLPSGPMELPAQGRWQSESVCERVVLTGLAFDSRSAADVSRLWDAVQGSCKELGLFLYDRTELSDLSADDAVSVAQISRFRIVGIGRFIYRQDVCRAGDDSIFIVHRGRVSLGHGFTSGREATLERLGPGCLFGGLPIVAETPNLETAVADEDCTLLEISRAAYGYMRVARPLLAQRLAQLVARSHTQRMRRLLELADAARAPHPPVSAR